MPWCLLRRFLQEFLVDVAYVILTVNFGDVGWCNFHSIKFFKIDFSEPRMLLYFFSSLFSTTDALSRLKNDYISFLPFS